MSDATEPLLEGLLSPEFLDDPYPTFAAIRREDPVFWVEPFNAWLLTRFADVKTAFTDDRFQARYEQHQTNRMGPSAVGQDYFKVGSQFIGTNDPPMHTKLKRIFRQPFNKQRVDSLVPGIEQLCNDLIDGFVGDGTVDIVQEYAHRVPISVMSRLLDVPNDYEPQIIEWITAFYGVLFVTPMSDEELVATNAACAEARDLFLDIIRHRRKNLGTDFVSELLAANDADDDPLTDEQIAINTFFLYFAGHDTQKGQFGMMVKTLADDPGALRILVDDPGFITTASPELYRYDATGGFMGRTLVDDVELGGKKLKAGTTLMCSMTAANRDPEAFPDPDTLVWNRDPAPGTTLQNMTFGTGRHGCLGRYMVWTNLPIMFRTLLERIGHFEMDQDNAVRVPTFEVRAYEHLPISWRR